MLQPQQRASRLRAVALASTVALAVALPLAAAVAGEDARLASEAAHQPARHADRTASDEDRQGAEDGHEGRGAARDRKDKDGADEERTGRDGAGERLQDGGKSLSRLEVPGVTGGAAGGRPVSSCGPEITSPEGVEAQTCVLTEARDTWARTYYRNVTNGRLDAALTLMRPDGRTTRVDCPMPPGGAAEVCETPRHRGPAGGGAGGRNEGTERAYSAMAEVASADGSRKLLRAGSNSPESAGS